MSNKPHNMSDLSSSNITGVLFVENEVSFLSCCKSKVDDTSNLVIVFASGYKSGAPRIRDQASTITFFSSGSLCYNDIAFDFHSWLFQQDAGLGLKAYFWGDLDFSGMGILASLRKIFPLMEAWEQGYGQMLRIIEDGEGHTPKEAKKQGQHDPVVTGCPYADSVLLPALRSSNIFLDQEQERSASILKTLKKIPNFKDEQEERKFWETHDTTDYLDWSKASPAVFPKLKPSRERKGRAKKS